MQISSNTHYTHEVSVTNAHIGAGRSKKWGREGGVWMGSFGSKEPRHSHNPKQYSLLLKSST